VLQTHFFPVDIICSKELRLTFAQYLCGEGYIGLSAVAAVTMTSCYLQVHIIGDGTADPVVVAGDKLSDQNELENIASSLALPTSIQTTCASLGEKLFE